MQNVLIDNNRPDNISLNIQQSRQLIQKISTNTFNLICNICNQYLSHAATTQCDHHFCDICIQQYILFLDECPQCHKKIRNQRISRNHLLDSMVVSYLKLLGDTHTQTTQYFERHEQYSSYKISRVINQLVSGDLVDVRNLDYVWLTGRVIRTINKYHDRKIKYYIVKYDHNKKKEEFPQTSPRLAPYGFFTSRLDIPKYKGGRKIVEDMQRSGTSYFLSQSDEQQPKPIKKLKVSQQQNKGE